MNLIVAIDNNRGIGCDGDLLFSIPEDMRFFREKTMGKVVVMGNLTLKSLPKSQPLPNRTNIVLSRSETEIDGAIVCKSVEELLEEVKKHDPDDVYVIGGQYVYEQLLPYCRRAYITKVNAVAAADRTFPNIDEMSEWELASESPARTHGGLEYVFAEYVNKS